MKKTLIYMLILIVASSLIFTSCAKASTTTSATTMQATKTLSASTPKRGGVLRVVPSSLAGAIIGYPPEIGTSSSHWSTLISMEGLLREKTNGQLEPRLATSYKLADDLKSVTFDLRKGVKFHDGSEFNAEAAKWNIDNAINAKVAPYLKSVDIVDNYTIRVNFIEWSNTVMNYFGDLEPLWMVSKASFDKNGLDWVRAHPVGTGPFKFASYEKDVAYKAVKNPDYWDKDEQGNQLPYLNEIDMVLISDPTTMKAAVQTGEVDMLSIMGGKTVSDLVNMGLTAKPLLMLAVCLWPDSVNPDSPLAKIKVREALEYAINRDEIAKTLGYGYWEPAYQLPAPGIPAFDSNFNLGRKYNPEKARQLLSEAGYSKIDTSIAAGFLYNSDAGIAIQRYLADVGINAKIELPQVPAFVSQYIRGTWRNALPYTPMPGAVNNSIYLNRFFGADYSAFASTLRPPEYLQALKTAMASRTFDLDLVRTCTNIISQNASMIPVVHSGRAWVYQPYVMDVHANETFEPTDWAPERVWVNK